MEDGHKAGCGDTQVSYPEMTLFKLLAFPPRARYSSTRVCIRTRPRITVLSHGRPPASQREMHITEGQKIKR